LEDLEQIVIQWFSDSFVLSFQNRSSSHKSHFEVFWTAVLVGRVRSWIEVLVVPRSLDGTRGREHIDPWMAKITGIGACFGHLF
jgi:hypothetical protein